MSSRKRRICHNITPQEIPSKRAKLLSTIWNTNEEEGEDRDITVDTTRSRSSTRRSRRKVKAIIGESLKEYLVDWEDLNNNQISKPSWVGCANLVIRKSAVKLPIDVDLIGRS